MGSFETVGEGSTFQDGTVIGNENMFGPKVKFGQRVSIGKKNVFGFSNEFGSNDNLGANNEFAREGLFGDKIMFGKNQEFGSRTTFATPEYFVSGEEFGSRNWGLQDSDLPDATDRKEWHMQMEKHPEYIPERIWRKKVLTLRQVRPEGSKPELGAAGSRIPEIVADEAARQIRKPEVGAAGTRIPEIVVNEAARQSDVKKAMVKQQARKAMAIAAIEKAATAAEAETKRLKKVADSLQQMRA